MKIRTLKAAMNIDVLKPGGRLGKILAAPAIFLAGLGSALAASPYTIVDIGPPPGFISSVGVGLNNFGQVTGSVVSDNGTPDHAFLWTPASANATSGSLSDLGIIVSGGSGSLKINDFGQVTLNGGLTGVPGLVAFLWTPATANGTTGTRVPFVSTSFPSSAAGLNNLGQVVGNMFPGTPYVWTPDARNGQSGQVNQTVAIGSNGPYLAPGYNSHGSATAINDSGQVTGAAVFDPYGREFIHNNGPISFPASNPYDFGTFLLSDVIGPPFQPNNQDGAGGAAAINAAGHTAGSRVFTNALGQSAGLPTYWDGTVFHSIGTATGTGANSINNHDDVVGESFLSSNDSQTDGFLYSKGVLTELKSLIDPSLGWRIFKGNAINDAGQIVGVGVHNGGTRAFLMTPVAAATCAKDVTALVTVSRSGPFYFGGKMRQTATITNISANPIAGPISLILSNLSANATLFNKTGNTNCAVPAGRPYIDVAGGLAPGANATLLLLFNDPTVTPVTYLIAPVLAGPNPR